MAVVGCACTRLIIHVSIVCAFTRSPSSAQGKSEAELAKEALANREAEAKVAADKAAADKAGGGWFGFGKKEAKPEAKGGITGTGEEVRVGMGSTPCPRMNTGLPL